MFVLIITFDFWSWIKHNLVSNRSFGNSFNSLLELVDVILTLFIKLCSRAVITVKNAPIKAPIMAINSANPISYPNELKILYK